MEHDPRRAEELSHAQVLAELSPALRPLLDAELDAGNRIRQATRSGPGLPPDGMLVLLHRPFLTISAHDLPRRLRIRDINDPHWWKTECIDDTMGHVLACGF